MIFNCAVVDDEFLARRYLTDYISRVPFLTLVGDYDSPMQITDEIRRGKIDLLFLDIQMPDISGLEFLKSVNPQPLIIFTTAYSEYALDGYEHNTVDYLLKPFSFERFLKAVNKAEGIASGRASKLWPAIKDREGFLTVRADRKLYRINYSDIIYIEGQKAYVTFHTREKKITALFSMKELEESLPGDMFVRIHKSFIAAVRLIDSLESGMISIASKKLPVGRSYREHLEEVFRNRS